MSYHLDDTIAAIATAASGGAARGIVRVSGPDAVAIAATCFKAADGQPLERFRRATAVAGEVHVGLDVTAKRRAVSCDLFVWPSSRSYTREPVVELHTLGSRPLLESMLAAVCSAGARLAEPGEYTLRAFLAGRLDLTQAEAVLGVIDAQGDGELRTALSQLAGGLTRPLDSLRDQLLQLLAELEAGLDFVDEDIQFVSTAEVIAQLEVARRRLQEVSEQITSRSTAGEVAQVVLTGAPNAGKSSLFNALVARFGCDPAVGGPRSTRALVSPERGTTRDYLTARIAVGGAECELVDTAGASKDLLPDDSGNAIAHIEAAARAVAGEQHRRAWVRLWCLDGGCTEDAAAIAADCDIVVLTKADVARRLPRLQNLPERSVMLVTSSVTGEGLDELGAALTKVLATETAAGNGQVVAATANRCRESIRGAEASLARAVAVATATGGDELVAIEVRDALNELGKVVGAVYTDDLLDRIFGTFCIGK